MKKALPLSLIIPCYNRVQQTKSLLDSLRKSTYTCEIILIDDCSTENINELVSKYNDLAIHYYRNDPNKGPAFSRNLGIQLSTYEYVAFTDNDCMVTENWLGNIYKSIIMSSDNIAGVGGKIVAKHNNIISLYYTYHKILDPWFYKGQFLYLVTANAIFKKKALQQVHCFDESITVPGGEDPGLCFKLINEGYKFAYNPEAIVIHDFQKGIRSFMRTFYRYGFGCSAQSKKYFKNIAFKSNEKFAGINES